MANLNIRLDDHTALRLAYLEEQTHMTRTDIFKSLVSFAAMCINELEQIKNNSRNNADSYERGFSKGQEVLIERLIKDL